MSSNTEPVNVRIFDREYTVGAIPEERDSLLAAARLVDSRMRELRGSNKMASIDRVAVLAALNLAHELQQLRAEVGQRDREITRTIAALQKKLDAVADSAL